MIKTPSKIVCPLCAKVIEDISHGYRYGKNRGRPWRAKYYPCECGITVILKEFLIKGQSFPNAPCVDESQRDESKHEVKKCLKCGANNPPDFDRCKGCLASLEDAGVTSSKRGFQ